MKVALVHDYLKEYGGAERVLEELHSIYPDATVFTTVYLPEYLGPHKKRFENWTIKTSWAQMLPFKQKLISPLRLLSPFLFRSFDFSGYDVVITSATGAYFPNLIDKKSAKLICYCHTPPRYLYGYATAREWRKNKIVNVLGSVANHFLRMIDFNASKNVDYYIANSHEVASRIQKFYKREAEVIYPPVALQKTVVKAQKEKDGYYLTGGRLARAKHVDLLVSTCTEMGLKLKVFGKGFAGFSEELQKKAGDSIEFVGEVTDTEKLALMAGAKAFLFASEDEDFGITPVEAMGQGTPVIAYRSGGVQETVVDGETGVFFDRLSNESLKQAINTFEKTTINPEACIKRAALFSQEHFKKQIEVFVKKTVAY